MTAKKGLTYRDAGVDVAAGNRAVRRIASVAAAATRPEVLGGIGGFGGLFRLPVRGMKSPVLVSATDGVGNSLSAAIGEPWTSVRWSHPNCCWHSTGREEVTDAATRRSNCHRCPVDTTIKWPS